MIHSPLLLFAIQTVVSLFAEVILRSRILARVPLSSPQLTASVRPNLPITPPPLLGRKRATAPLSNQAVAMVRLRDTATRKFNQLILKPFKYT